MRTSYEVDAQVRVDAEGPRRRISPPAISLVVPTAPSNATNRYVKADSCVWIRLRYTTRAGAVRIQRPVTFHRAYFIRRPTGKRFGGNASGRPQIGNCVERIQLWGDIAGITETTTWHRGASRCLRRGRPRDGIICAQCPHSGNFSQRNVDAARLIPA